MNTRVVLTRWLSAPRTVRAVAHHVRLDALLRTGHAVSARHPTRSGPSAVDPVDFLDLIRATAERTFVHDASDVRITV